MTAGCPYTLQWDRGTPPSPSKLPLPVGELDPIGRIKASAGPSAVPNAGLLQIHKLHKNFPLPPIVGPQNCGPGCCSTPSRPLNAALMSPSNTWFPGPTRVFDPNGISIGSAVFAGLSSATDRPADRPRYSVGNNRPHLCR